jgi:hypothetical protein
MARNVTEAFVHGVQISGTILKLLILSLLLRQSYDISLSERVSVILMGELEMIGVRLD